MKSIVDQGLSYIEVLVSTVIISTVALGTLSLIRQGTLFSRIQIQETQTQIMQASFYERQQAFRISVNPIR